MKDNIIYDIAGIGIGPFNLGLAALCEPVAALKTVFFEQKSEFGWHERMMIPGTTLQVSYLADLVTLADPSSKYSYLNFLRKQNRLIQFGIYEQHYLSRSEYNRYCKWVCSQLDNLVFSFKVMDFVFDRNQDVFKIKVSNHSGESCIYYAKHIIVGTGTVPFIPNQIKAALGKKVIHSSQYLNHKEIISKSKKVIIIGSGQSAAEIFYDLLNDNTYHNLSWITRSDHFYAMEHNKLAYEMSSPDYIDFFYNLEPAHKSILLSKQNHLYKGINYQLINAIYERLYDNFIEGKSEFASIRTGLKLKNILKNKSRLQIIFTQNHTNKEHCEEADILILATGYQYEFPRCIEGIKNLIQLDTANRFIVNRNYSVDKANRIFAQNAEIHTHGFNAPDLGLGPYRNAVIINTILGYEYYPVDTKVAFQKFGLTG